MNKSEKAGDHPERWELEQGLKFNHIVGDALRNELAACNAHVFAIIDLLVRKGITSFREMEDLRKENDERASNSLELVPPVYLMPIENKYDPELYNEVECADRVHLCGAACCRVPFPLSVQDLEEGNIRWDYFRPYTIARRTDGACVHLGEDGQCTIYEQRPAFCRHFDCRRDESIWVDFENMVVHPNVHELGRPDED